MNVFLLPNFFHVFTIELQFIYLVKILYFKIVYFLIFLDNIYTVVGSPKSMYTGLALSGIKLPKIFLHVLPAIRALK